MLFITGKRVERVLPSQEPKNDSESANFRHLPSCPQSLELDNMDLEEKLITVPSDPIPTDNMESSTAGESEVKSSSPSQGDGCWAGFVASPHLKNWFLTLTIWTLIAVQIYCQCWIKTLCICDCYIFSWDSIDEYVMKLKMPRVLDTCNLFLYQLDCVHIVKILKQIHRTIIPSQCIMLRCPTWPNLDECDSYDLECGRPCDFAYKSRGWWWACIVVAYLLHLIECYFAGSHKFLRNSHVKETIYEFVDRIRQNEPSIWWKVQCYHYETRSRLVTTTDSNGNTTTRYSVHDE